MTMPAIVFGDDYVAGVENQLFWTIGGHEKLKASGVWNGVAAPPSVDQVLSANWNGAPPTIDEIFAAGPGACTAEIAAVRAPPASIPATTLNVPAAAAPPPTSMTPPAPPTISRSVLRPDDRGLAAYARGREIALRVLGRPPETTTREQTGRERALEIARAARAKQRNGG